MLPFLTGLGAGLSLIVAIGAQNAFVLRQGLKREAVLPVVLVCLVSDAVLILAGVAGIGALIQGAPVLLAVVRWVGIAFLLAYAVFAARRALRPGILKAADSPVRGTVWSAVLTAAAITWLNPHVYLDTLVLLGSLASTHGGSCKWLFGAGAAAGSALWFPLIGYGARGLSGFFARPASWRFLDGGVAVLMLTLAIVLATGH
ncbi:LysE/ArgO family amino acid transporter [Arthrobacter globiformis]|uniref:LysE/ArgO family amino acid transporter n=1 Tax=Arthrobacter globiformis TaxID=1665 RepID=UPI00278ED7AB|nr:LysE/ArgO family amino acid transporter [Arthrobacter globiformis]MDQ0616111.1 L-lysine exporter family protein LysE/ArgO [Arthrobacter globiformis]